MYMYWKKLVSVRFCFLCLDLNLYPACGVGIHFVMNADINTGMLKLLMCIENHRKNLEIIRVQATCIQHLSGAAVNSQH